MLWDAAGVSARGRARDGNAGNALELYRTAGASSPHRYCENAASKPVGAIRAVPLSPIALIVFNENGFIRVDCTV